MSITRARGDLGAEQLVELHVVDQHQGTAAARSMTPAVL